MMENIFARRIAAVVNVNLVMINQVLANCLAMPSTIACESYTERNET